ncbi:MAG: extracellular solute-binding protein [Spirochaetaceae bacterium]|jgi:raffinose/stachyose/melibiose transport system substrate-binding protein|nr:extracellular solute-binding protein [Spirochaetaceae bacterium]
MKFSKFFIMGLMFFAVSFGRGGGSLVFAGGGKQSGVTLTVWHQSVGETDPSARILKQLIDQWNREHPDITVVEDGVTGEQYKTKINTALAANDAPDIFYMWGGSFSRPFIEAGKMLDITDLIPASTKNAIIPGAIEAVTVNGRVYSYPCYTHIASLYCNTELFEKAGARIPATYRELLDAVKKLKAAGITPAVLGEKDRWPGMYWFDIIAMRQAGSPASMAAMRDPAKFDSPDFIEAARKVQELADAGLFNSSLFSMSYDEMLGAFNNGQGAMMFQANWINAGIEDRSSAVRGKVTAIPFPVFEGGKGKAGEFFGGGIDSYYIYSGTKHPKEAAQFLAWFSENLGKQGYLAGAGLPCWKTDGLDTSSITGLDKEVAALMETAESFIPWWDNILPADASETHKNLIADLLAKNITPQQFAREMAKVAKSDL